MPHTVKDPITVSKVFQQSKRGLLKIIFGRTMLILVLLLLHFLIMFAVLLDLFEQVPMFFGGVTIFTAVNLIYVMNTKENPSVKLSWCFVIAVFPLLGAVLYFFVRFDAGYRLGKRLLQKTVDQTRFLLPEQESLMNAIKQEDPDFYNLSVYLRRYGGSPVYDHTQVTYFPLGEEKFQQMLQQLETAERFIFLEYFFIGPSYMWDRILEILIRKAREGVEVRVMYDGSCAVSMLPHDYPRQLEKLGISCRVFFPFHPFISTHYNNRDHRKILIIDGHTAFTGGVNLQDRYINRRELYGHWKDTAVMLRGDAAQGFTMMFLQMWNHMEQQPVYSPYLRPAADSSPAPGYVIPYSDSPLDGEHVGKMVYLHILNQAKDYVYIMTPYLILDNELLTAMEFAAKRGVDVRILLPHIPDKRTAFALAKSHYRELTEAGVQIYEYTPGFVHGKVFLSDDRHGVVGTINLDYRSLYLHFECAAYLYKVPALQDIRQDFADCFQKSRLITQADIRNQSLIARITAAVLKLFAPLM